MLQALSCGSKFPAILHSTWTHCFISLNLRELLDSLCVSILTWFCWRIFEFSLEFSLDFEYTKHWFFYQTLRIHEIIIEFPPPLVCWFSSVSIPNKYALKHGKSRKYMMEGSDRRRNSIFSERTFAFELQKFVLFALFSLVWPSLCRSH